MVLAQIEPLSLFPLLRLIFIGGLPAPGSLCPRWEGAVALVVSFIISRLTVGVVRCLGGGGPGAQVGLGLTSADAHSCHLLCVISYLLFSIFFFLTSLVSTLV